MISTRIASTAAVFILLLAGCQAVRDLERSPAPARAWEGEGEPAAVSQRNEARSALQVSNADPTAIDDASPRLRRLPRVPPAAVQAAAFLQPATEPPRPQEVLPPTDAEPQGLALSQLEDLALTNNPSLAEARARIDAARGRWIQVGLPPNTSLGYSGQQLGSEGLAEQRGLYVGQEWIRGGKLRLNRAVVAQEIRQAEQDWAAQRRRVLTDVGLGFYEVLTAERRQETSRQLMQIAGQAVTGAEALLQAQEVSQIDVARARLELQAAELELENSRVQYEAAWSRLAAVLGLPNLTPQPLRGDLERVPAQMSRDEALQRLVAASPEVAAATAEVARARRQIDRALAEPVPDVDVQAVCQQDNGTDGYNANLQVSLPIPWLDRNQGGIRQAQAQLVQAERALQRLELGLGQRLASVYQRYAMARNQVVAYTQQGGILENAQTTLDFIRRGYQAGELAYLDLLTAQRNFSQTNMAYVEALGAMWAAAVEIDGLLLKGSLASGADPGEEGTPATAMNVPLLW
jgi:cobalt-zinc-cadmium efflux system outer membrane protein